MTNAINGSTNSPNVCVIAGASNVQKSSAPLCNNADTTEQMNDIAALQTPQASPISAEPVNVLTQIANQKI